MAPAGGMGVIPGFDTGGNRRIRSAGEEVRVRDGGNPVTIGPEATLADALSLDGRSIFRAFPWSRAAASGQAVGILPTNRESVFRDDHRQRGGELMTKDPGHRAARSADGRGQASAYQHRIEKLVVVDG